MAVVVAPGIGEGEDRLLRDGCGGHREEDGDEEGGKDLEAAELHNVSRNEIFIDASRPGMNARAKNGAG